MLFERSNWIYLSKGSMNCKVQGVKGARFPAMLGAFGVANAKLALISHLDGQSVPCGNGGGGLVFCRLQLHHCMNLHLQCVCDSCDRGQSGMEILARIFRRAGPGIHFPSRDHLPRRLRNLLHTWAGLDECRCWFAAGFAMVDCGWMGIACLACLAAMRKPHAGSKRFAFQFLTRFTDVPPLLKYCTVHTYTLHPPSSVIPHGLGCHAQFLDMIPLFGMGNSWRKPIVLFRVEQKVE